MERHHLISRAKRIVIKLGTNAVTRSDGNIAIGRVYSIIENIADLMQQDKEVIIVSSGAVGLGVKHLQLSAKPKDLPSKQACAAIGQGRLISIYTAGFERLGILTAQVLLTEEDFSNRIRYLNLRNTLNRLVDLKVVPIINENDTVSTSELESLDENEKDKIINFGDNDKLSALVASKLNADMLVMLTDVEGLYNKNPQDHADAQLIPLVRKIDIKIEGLGYKGSEAGRGGMATKLEAAKIAVNSGSMAIIANSHIPHVVEKIFKGDIIGTCFLPQEGLSSRERWIAYANTIIGRVIVNQCALEALLTGKVSLLPVGVIDVQHDFHKGDVISIISEQGTEIARGITNYSSKDAKKIIGLKSSQFCTMLDYQGYDELISRDNLVLI